MVFSPDKKSALRAKLARRKAVASGESPSAARQLNFDMGGGARSVSSVQSVPLCFGTDVAYVAMPSLVCLAPIGAAGNKCCLNLLPCPTRSHKHPASANESNPFFIELVTKSSGANSSTGSNPRGHSHVRLPVNGAVEEKFIERLLEETSENWPGRFSQLENGNTDLSLKQLLRTDELLLTVVKHRPAEVLESNSSEFKADEVSQEPTDDTMDPLELDTWFDLLKGHKDMLEQMVELGDVTAEGQKKEDGSFEPARFAYKFQEDDFLEMGKEIFRQLFSLFEASEAIAFFLELAHKMNNRKLSSIQELVDGLSVLIKSVASDLGLRSKASELPSNAWAAIESTALDLTGCKEEVAKVAATLLWVEKEVKKFTEILEEDEDSSMEELNGGDKCCEMVGCGCSEKFTENDRRFQELQRHVTELGSQISHNSSSSAAAVLVPGKQLKDRDEVAAHLASWFPEGSTPVCASLFPTPHLIMNQVWAQVANCASTNFTDTDLLRLKINHRTAESFEAVRRYLPMFMRADGPPKGFNLQSSKKDREGSEAFKSIPSAKDFGRKSDHLLYGRFADALRNVENRYDNYLQQRLGSHPEKYCYQMATQCLKDSVAHVENIFSFMEDQYYRNVKSFGESKSVMAWNLVCSCIRDIYEQHFRSSLDLVTADSLSDPVFASIDAIYCSWSLNGLVRQLNKLSIKHHPSVNSSLLRFMMESISDLSDTSKSSKSLESDMKDLKKENSSLKSELAKVKEELSSVKESSKRDAGNFTKQFKEIK